MPSEFNPQPFDCPECPECHAPRTENSAGIVRHRPLPRLPLADAGDTGSDEIPLMHDHA